MTDKTREAAIERARDWLEGNDWFGAEVIDPDKAELSGILADFALAETASLRAEVERLKLAYDAEISENNRLRDYVGERAIAKDPTEKI